MKKRHMLNPRSSVPRSVGWGAWPQRPCTEDLLGEGGQLNPFARMGPGVEGSESHAQDCIFNTLPPRWLLWGKGMERIYVL